MKIETMRPNMLYLAMLVSQCLPPNGLATPVIFWTSRAAGSDEQIFGADKQVAGEGQSD